MSKWRRLLFYDKESADAYMFKFASMRFKCSSFRSANCHCVFKYTFGFEHYNSRARYHSFCIFLKVVLSAEPKEVLVDLDVLLLGD